MKKILRVASAAALLALTACGTETEFVANEPSGSEVEAPGSYTEGSEETTDATVGEMHAEMENGGVTLTVDEVVESPSTLLEPDGVKKGAYPPEEEKPKNKKAKFVKVKTTVRNDSKSPWDLTCDYAVGTVLLDKDGRQYDEIESLYRVPENPDCNDSLGPGFDTTMSWIYEVPENSEITRFGFFDPSVNYEEPTLINLKVSTEAN